MKTIFVVLAFCLCTGQATAATTTHDRFQLIVHANPGDSVSVILWDHYFSHHKQFVFPYRQVVLNEATGVNRFRFSGIKGPVYFEVHWIGKKIDALRGYIAFPGDSVAIRLSETNAPFSGRGALRMNCRYTLDSVKTKTYFSLIRGISVNRMLGDRKPVQYLQTCLPAIDAAFRQEIQVLNEWKPQLDPASFQLLEADAIGAFITNKYQYYRSAAAVKPRNPDSAAIIEKQLRQLYDGSYQPARGNTGSELLAYAKNYVNALLCTILLDIPRDSADRILHVLQREYKGSVRDMAIALYLFDYLPDQLANDSLLSAAAAGMNHGFCKDMVNTYRIKYLRGITAYDFSLPDVNGRTRRLHEFRGKKVVMDVWFSGCTACVQFYKGALKTLEEKYAGDSSIVFVSIAVATDKTTWLDCIRKDIYTSALAVNLNDVRSFAQSQVGIHYGIAGAPTLVIVDEKGKIAYNGFAPRTPHELEALIKKN